MSAPRNHLGDETSPYLQQHADNPVEWYPWSEAALAKARAENKPILLSIGYSACHWCHVMAHESFENEETAAVMNRLFVNIKVDREERPDLDKIYQNAHYLLVRRNGGWPLTMFLTPDQQLPFFGGTYFPGKASHGLPAFSALLERVEQFFRTQTEQLGEQNQALLEALQNSFSETTGEAVTLTPTPLERGLGQLAQQYDSTHGGFGTTPKFPMHSSLEFCLRNWLSSGEEQALAMLEHTLHALASSGLYDHLGGGFYRYAVDAAWTIPHFEKMLYDNGQLLSLYAALAEATDNNRFDRVMLECGNWVLREMEAPDGGYYSTIDADSESEEGRYYLWQPDEVQNLLTPEENTVVSALFGLDGPANFEDRAWHLLASKPISTVAEALNYSDKRVIVILSAALPKLLAARDQRQRPGLDDKLLTSWNGLMIRALAMAGRWLGEQRFIDSAERALDLIHDQFWQSGRLLATGKDGVVRLNAYLDDYVLLIEAILELLQCRWRSSDLQFAIALAEVVLGHFNDPQQGGFYFTSDDHETLLTRPKSLGDDALPAGNGVAARVLQRLGHLLGEPRYLAAAETALQAAWPALEQAPIAHTGLLSALDEWLTPPPTVILRGSPEALASWTKQLRGSYRIDRQIFAVPEDADDLPTLLATRAPEPGQVVAYLCRGEQCDAPYREPAALLQALTANQ